MELKLDLNSNKFILESKKIALDNNNFVSAQWQR